MELLNQLPHLSRIKRKLKGKISQEHKSKNDKRNNAERRESLWRKKKKKMNKTGKREKL